MFKKVWTRLEGICCLLAKKNKSRLEEHCQNPQCASNLTRRTHTLGNCHFRGGSSIPLTSCGLAMYCFKQLYCSLCCLCLWNIQWILVIFRDVWWSTSLWSRWLSQHPGVNLYVSRILQRCWTRAPNIPSTRQACPFGDLGMSGMGGLFIVLWRCQQKWWSWLLIGLSLEM